MAKKPQLKDTAKGKGLRTALQTMLGLLVGLLVTVWAVPGVPEAVQSYLVENVGQLLLTVGVPAGLIAWAQNYYEGR